jgi:hypothetical protein
VSQQEIPPLKLPFAGPPGRGRRIAVYSLLAVAGVLLFLTSFAVWVNRVALNTGQFVDTSSELIEDDAIRRAIATRAVDELYANVDVQAELKKQLPKDFKPASGVVAALGREGAYLLADRALEQRQLQSVWRATLRQSHTELVDVLEGGGTSVSNQEGVVTLDLRPIVLDTAGRIGIRQTVEDNLGPDVARIEVLRSNELDAAQAGFELLKTLAWFLPVLMLIFFGLAVFLARGRRRATLRDAGIVIFAAAVVGLVAVGVVGGYVVDSLTTDKDTRNAGNDAWHIVTQLLRSSLHWQLVVGVLVVVAAWLAGPRRYALASREAVSPLLRARVYSYSALAVVALALLVSAPVNDFARLLFVGVSVGMLAAGIEILRTQTLREFPDASGGIALAEARAKMTGWLEAQRLARTTALPRSGERSEATLASQLRDLAELHASGALTDEEFVAAKARVLAGD